MFAEMALAQSRQIQVTCRSGRVWSKPFATQPSPEEMTAMEEELLERLYRAGYRRGRVGAAIEIIPASRLAIEYASRGYVGSPTCAV